MMATGPVRPSGLLPGRSARAAAPGAASRGPDAVPPPPPVQPAPTLQTEPEPRIVRVRAHAPLVAHLAATHLGLAQTRDRRRTEPQEAAAAYAACRDGIAARRRRPLPSLIA